MNKLTNDITLSRHKPEAPAKENAGLRWRFRLCPGSESDQVIYARALTLTVSAGRVKSTVT